MKNQTKIIIIGLGESGVSVAKFLQRKKIPFSVCDTREKPSNLEKFQTEFPHVTIHLGKLNADLLKSAAQLIVSPGVAISTPAIVAAASVGVEIIGDIELFIRHCTKPIIAITGSNGKTTTTILVGDMARASGFKVGVGGNIEINGVSRPALDLLEHDYDLFVLELSSFQLETTDSLHAAAAVCLNVSENHMDRYNSFTDYIQAKNKIYKNSKTSVINLDSCESWQTAELSQNRIGFMVEHSPHPNPSPQAREGIGSLLNDPIPFLGYSRGRGGAAENRQNLPCSHYFSLRSNELYCDDELWLSVDDLKIKTKHFCANLLAAFALGYGAGFKKDAMIEVAKNFSGVVHRCQTIAKRNDIVWINDSKATTVAATTAALESVSETINGQIVLIAGGEGKGADFSGLAVPIQMNCKAVILLGRDADKIAAILPDEIQRIFVKSMSEAVITATKLAKSGDAVLLSTACASTDMFKNYLDRGNQFIQCVNKVE